MNKKLSTLVTIALALLIVLGSAVTVQAQGEVCENGNCPDASNPGSQSKEGLGGIYNTTLRGGYTAAGVGLRNRGSGVIALTGLPAGAKVVKAFLYWNIVDLQQLYRHQQVNFAGHALVGAFIGADMQPCVLSEYYSTYSYRADVTKYVTKNGNYALSGVASGLTSGVDPSSSATKAPLAQGASLVVIYSKAIYPMTQFFIWDGALTLRPETGAGSPPGRFIVMGPFTAPATTPVGPVYATAIVANGHNNLGGPVMTANGVEIPNSNFDGTDPVAGADFTNGNLWDTKRLSIGRYLYPGDTSVAVGLNYYGDCATWTAEVLSISSGTLDTDKDALLDGWEANGYDHNGDHTVDVDLLAMGASPFHKDIFVEHDYMPEHKPTLAVLNKVTAAFAVAPVANPDGKSGIALHNDIGQGGAYIGGNSVPEADNMGATCTDADIWSGFDAYKIVNFADTRWNIFHYAIWAHNQCPVNSSSGLARGIPSSDFMITLGLWQDFGSDNERTGTFMHELGHNLGLTHGGGPGDHVNYKPNHLSVMNYFFQVIGVWRDGAPRWDYTRTTTNALNELALNELTGLTGGAGLASYGTRYYCPSKSVREDRTIASIDWNCNNVLANGASVDINNDGMKDILKAVPNQWTHLVFNGGSVGAGLKALPFKPLGPEIFFTLSPELRYEDTLKK